MKTTNWICWLLALCVCLAETKNNIRRPLSPAYPNALVLKKPRPMTIGHRISMGNAIHIGGNPSLQRIPYKHIGHRIRRPPAAYSVSPINWKNRIPIRSPMNNRGMLPQRAPVKEFHSASKAPEYSPEYKPELVILPATHRGSVDDDKGPIHTIPAPNLSPADKPFNSAIVASAEEIANRRPAYSSNLNYRIGALQNPNVGALTTAGGVLASQSAAATSSSQRHQYEVTESNDLAVLREHQTVQPASLQPQQSLDVTRLYSTIIDPHAQSNEILANRPLNAGIAGSNVQFPGQPDVPMQTNLHSSLHVGFPAQAVQAPYAIVQQQIPDLRAGHPAVLESPSSATQLYDLLNNFPHTFVEQYAPDQQHALQQQLGQIFQTDAVTSFSQPQMQSFNYDEQANQLQQQQQQIPLDQDYALESVTADYNLDPAKSPVDVIRKQNHDVRANERFIYPADGTEQSENNIEYDETNRKRSSTLYFKKMNDDDTIPTKFYTTLPNREAAEKLAALAAAGNVNSRLIGQLRRRQQENMQNIDSMPSNHKNDDDGANQQRTDGDQVQQYNEYKPHRKSQQHEQKQNYKVQNGEKSPLQITVTDEDDYISNDQQDGTKRDNLDMEYEYDNEDGENEDPQFSSSFNGKITSHDDDSSNIEFGSRLRPTTKE